VTSAKRRTIKPHPPDFRRSIGDVIDTYVSFLE
jgi:hypothetical protein